jgi:hypothetical protein
MASTVRYLRSIDKRHHKSTGVIEKDIIDIAVVLRDKDCQPEVPGVDGP